MVTILLSIGLAVMPYLTLFGFHNNSSMVGFGIFIAAVLCLWGYFCEEQKPLKNKWLLFFAGYILISSWQAPFPEVSVFGVAIGNFWIWQPIAMVFIYLGMYKTISGAVITEKQKDIIFDILTFVGLLTAIHCIGQWFGIMQWFVPKGGYYEAMTSSTRVAGTLGNPTFVGPYIMMLIPFALFRKRYLFAGVMVVGVLVTHGQIAIGSMIVMLGALLCFKFKKLIVPILATFVLIGGTLFIGKVANIQPISSFVNDSTRFEHWEKILIHTNKPCPTGKKYPYTGRGAGSFYYTFRPESGTTFDKAHNEYLEVLYDTGIIGAFLFIMSLFYIFKNSILTERNKYLMASFIGACICASGIFIWHLGATLFLTVAVMGLINNEQSKGV